MKYLSFVPIFLVMILITSCQKSSQTEITKIEKVPAAKLRVAISFQVNPSRYFQMTDKIEQFTEKYPQVEIEVVRIKETIKGFNDLIKESDSLPDIIELNPNQVRLSLKNQLENLDTYVNAEIERLSMYSEGEQSPWSGTYAKLNDAAKIDGEMYIAPVRSAAMVILYNKTIFKELGITEPAEGWTWEQFLDAAQSLKKHNYFTFIPPSLDYIEPLIRSLGGSYSSSDHSNLIGYLDGEATITAFERLSEASFFDEASYNAKTHGISFTPTGTLSSLYSDLTSTDDYALAPMPLLENGQPQNSANITGLAISKNSVHKEAAWQLIQFIIGQSDEEATRFVASNTLQFGEERFHPNPSARQDMLMEYVINQMSSVVPSTLYITTGNDEYEGSQFFSPNIRSSKDFKNILEGKDIKSSLVNIAKEMEGKLRTVYDKP